MGLRLKFNLILLLVITAGFITVAAIGGGMSKGASPVKIE